MHIAFLNPQGNFDPTDAHLTEHPDFGGQLVYVKEVAMAMAAMGHKVDIVTRRIDDPEWPEFAGADDRYPGHENLRILRFSCGGPKFLPKEELWPHLPEFVDNIVSFYGQGLPDFTTAHYADGAYCSALMGAKTGIGFTFTGHSLGAQKMDKLGAAPGTFAGIDARFHFSQRIATERTGMARAYRIITSTDQERRDQYGHPLYAGAVDTADTQRFSVIPPGVNTRVFTSAPADRDAADHNRFAAILGSAGGMPWVVLSSRLDDKKNIIGAVEAFACSERLRSMAGLALFVRGVDDPWAAIETLPAAEKEVLRPILHVIEGAGFKDRVRFFNIRSQGELASAYRFFARLGSVFALPSLYEPFGLAPIEAAACGLACVATKNGGPEEIFADGSGILVDPFDPRDIANGLLEGLTHQKALAHRAHERVLGTYTWEQTAAGYLSVIEDGVTAGEASRDPVPELDAGELIADYLASDASAE